MTSNCFRSVRIQDNSNTAVNLRCVVKEALQVFECSLESFAVDETTHAMRSIPTIDTVLLKEKWHRVLLEGRRRFPNLLIDYGFRNNAQFWFARHSPPYREPIPKSKAATVDSVMWAVTRGGFAVDLEWQPQAAARLVSVPPRFPRTGSHGHRR